MKTCSRRDAAFLQSRRFAAKVPARSEEQSTQLLHQRVYAPPAPLAGPPTPLQGHKSNQCSKGNRNSQSQTPSHSEVCSKCHSLETTCEWKCNIAVARLFSSDTTTLQSPPLSRLSRPCLIDSPSILKKVEHAILGVHLQHDTPDTDDSQHTPPSRGTFMP